MGEVDAWIEDCRIVTRQGEERWIADTSVELRDREGRSVGSIGLLQDITERKRTEEQLRRQAARLQVLAEAAQIFAERTSDYQSVLDTITRRAVAWLGDRCTIQLLSDDGLWLDLAALYDNDPEVLAVLHTSLAAQQQRADEQPLAKRILETGQPVLESATNLDSWYATFTSAEGTFTDRAGSHSSIIAPMHSRGRILGLLHIGRYRATQGPFDEEDLQLVKDLADRAALAISNARLFAESQHQARRAEALMRIGNRLNAHLDLETILKTVCEETAQALQVPAVSLSLYAESSGQFYHAADLGLPPEYRQQVQPVSRAYIDEMVARTVTLAPAAKEQGLIIRPDVQQSVGAPNAALYATHDIRTIVSLSLVHVNKLIGRLTLYTQGQTRHFAPEELALLQGLANQAAQALANARLYADAQRRLHQLQALNTIDRAILSMQDMTAINQVVAEQVATQLGVDAFSVMLFDQERQILTNVASTGFRGAGMRCTTARLGEGFVGQAVRERQSHHVINLTEIDNCRRNPLLEGEDFVSYCSVPLLIQNEVIGVLELFHRTPLAPDPEWWSFLDGLALQTALAIHHTQLFTQTRHLLQQTQEQAQQLQEIMDTVPEGVLFLDSTYHLQMANQTARAQLGLLAPEVNGEPLTHLGESHIGGLLDGAVELGWQEVCVENGQYRFEVAARTMQSDSHVQGWVLVLRDVTLERQRQRVLRVQERLATVGQLAAGIAHDFNNILTPILLYTELTMARLPAGDQAHANLEEVLVAAQRARDLVFQILTFSREESQQPRQSLQMQPILKEVLRLVRAALPTTIEIRQNIDWTAAAVLANPAQIHQVVMNLCTNANHAMQEHGGTLTVNLDTVQVDEAWAAARPHLKVGPYVQLTVSDTGHGIDPSIVTRIFDPFFTTKAPGEGTGLGLSVVYGIVMDCGGDITVDSRLGDGMVFQIYLPVAGYELTVEEARPSVAQQGIERILLVDDEEMIVGIASEILTSLGYTVTGKSDSIEALALFQAQPNQFDLLITDLTMPHMTGTKLITEVLSLRPDLPILLMSGGSEILTLTTPERSGVGVTLRKPFTARDLSQTVRNLLQS